MRRVVSMLLVSGFMLVVAMVFAFTVHGQGHAVDPAAKSIKNPVKPTAASVTAGAAAYKKYCAYCHGVAAKGDGPLAPKDSNPSDLTDAEWVHGSTDGEIFTVIANGLGADSKMLKFKGKIPDQNIWNIVNFLRSLGPKGTVR
jgi:mono/diheme cytochrome c family protein